MVHVDRNCHKPDIRFEHPGTPSMDATIAQLTDTLYEMRLETLLSVDDLVAAVLNVLEVGVCGCLATCPQ